LLIVHLIECNLRAKPGSSNHIVDKYLVSLFPAGPSQGLNISKGIESLPQTQIFKHLYFLNLMLYTFDISNSDYLIKQNS